MFHLQTTDIIIRIFIAALVGGVVGYDRAQHNHPAGLRTHILVCVGACILGLAEVAAGKEMIGLAMHSTKGAFALRSDITRLIAQVVNGIGFLGAGTIVITRRFVTGLTTAASLWTVAAIGLTDGMGFYQIALIGTVMVLFDLLVLHKIVPTDPVRKVEVKFYNGSKNSPKLDEFFKEHAVQANHLGYKSTNDSDDETKRVYTSIYKVKLPKDRKFSDLIAELAKNPDIVQVNVFNM